MCTEDSPSGLWRTLGKRVGCKPSGVRIPHPPPPDPGTASGSGVFVACDAAGVPGAVGPGRLDGPGRCVCRWAAARPRAVRAASFARRVASKPGQAPPPPTGTAARSSGPSGALHTGGTCVAWTSPARPCCQSHFTPSRRTLIAESTINFACNSLTALSNYEFRLLELQRFQTLLTLLPIELHATFLRPGSVVTFELRSQALRLEVRSVPPVSATPGVLPGGLHERNIAPA